MIKQIELKDNFGIYKNKEDYILADNDNLIMEFLFNIPNCKLIVKLVNNKTSTTIKLENNKLEVPKKLIFAGTINGYVKMYQNGLEIKKFLLEDLIIKELSIEKYVIPQIEFLKKDYVEFKTDLLEKYNTLKVQNDLLTKLVYAMCDIEFKGDKND